MGRIYAVTFFTFLSKLNHMLASGVKGLLWQPGWIHKKQPVAKGVTRNNRSHEAQKEGIQISNRIKRPPQTFENKTVCQHSYYSVAE